MLKGNKGFFSRIERQAVAESWLLSLLGCFFSYFMDAGKKLAQPIMSLHAWPFAPASIPSAPQHPHMQQANIWAYFSIRARAPQMFPKRYAEWDALNEKRPPPARDENSTLLIFKSHRLRFCVCKGAWYVQGRSVTWPTCARRMPLLRVCLWARPMTKVFSALRFVNVEYANEGENNTRLPVRW